jgi:hypothetical protein
MESGEAEGHLTPGANILFVDNLDELTSSATIRNAAVTEC